MTTTSTARSNASQLPSSSWLSDSIGRLGIFDMQPLSRVSPNASVHFGAPDTMQQRPGLAIKIAHCISQFSSLETMLGMSLALMLHADARVMLGMYTALENRSAQLKNSSSRSKGKTRSKINTMCSNVLLSVFVRPLMKTRDKFAHWVWGMTDDLPSALLLTDSSDSMYIIWV